MKTIARLRIALLLAWIFCFLGLRGRAQDSLWIPAESVDMPDCVVENLHFFNPNEGWAVGYIANRAGQYALLRTADSGRTWRGEPIDRQQYRIYKGAYFLTPTEGWAPADTGLEAHVDDALYGRVNGHNPGEDNSLDAPIRFYRTQDGGWTWTLRQGVITETVVLDGKEVAASADRKYLSVIAFPSRSVGVMGGVIGQFVPRNFFPGVSFKGYVLLSTRDGGNTWKASFWGDSRLPECEGEDWSPHVIMSADVVGETHGWMPAGGCHASHLFRTSDGGATWDVLTDTRLFVSRDGWYVDFTTPFDGWGWTTVNSRLYSTSNGGETWNGISLGIANALVFASPLEGWIMGFVRASDLRFGIHHTNDGGQSWMLEFLPNPGDDIRDMKFDRTTQSIWTYGRGTVLKRKNTTASVEPRGKLAVTWGTLKSRK